MDDSTYRPRLAAALRHRVHGPDVAAALLGVAAPGGIVAGETSKDVVHSLVRDPKTSPALLHTAAEDLDTYAADLAFASAANLDGDLLTRVSLALGYDMHSKAPVTEPYAGSANVLLWQLDLREHLAGILQCGGPADLTGRVLMDVLTCRDDPALTRNVLDHAINELHSHTVLVAAWRTSRLGRPPISAADLLALVAEDRAESVALTLTGASLMDTRLEALRTFCDWLDATGNSHAAEIVRVLPVDSEGIGNLRLLASDPDGAAAALRRRLRPAGAPPRLAAPQEREKLLRGTAVEQAALVVRYPDTVSTLTGPELAWLGNGQHNGPTQTQLPVRRLLNLPAALEVSEDVIVNLLRRGQASDMMEWLQGDLRVKPTLTALEELLRLPGFAPGDMGPARAWTDEEAAPLHLDRTDLLDIAVTGKHRPTDAAWVDPLVDAYGTQPLLPVPTHRFALKVRAGQDPWVTTHPSLRRLAQLLTDRFGDDPGPWLSALDLLTAGIDMSLPDFVETVAALHQQVAA